jgi:hypothetical protein
MEASGQARCFERLLSELQLELWIGDAAEIRAKRVRKQKTDRQASLGLDLALLQLERNGALLRVHGEVLSKQYLTPPTLSETPVIDNREKKEPWRVGFGLRKLVVENNIKQRAVDLQTAVVVNETQFPEPVHEKADPRPGCAHHFG